MAAEQVAFDCVDHRAGDDRDTDGHGELHHKPYLHEWDDDEWGDLLVPAEDVYGDDFDGELSCAAKRSGDYDDVPFSGEPGGQGAGVYRYR
jgi:hypothetical protein